MNALAELAMLLVSHAVVGPSEKKKKPSEAMEIHTGYEGSNSFMYFLEGAIQKGLVLLTP